MIEDLTDLSLDDIKSAIVDFGYKFHKIYNFPVINGEIDDELKILVQIEKIYHTDIIDNLEFFEKKFIRRKIENDYGMLSDFVFLANLKNKDKFYSLILFHDMPEQDKMTLYKLSNDDTIFFYAKLLT
jgi:hypothetical protein